MLSPPLSRRVRFGVVQSFLLDQGCKLGITNKRALGQVAMRVVVMQDGNGYDASAGIRAVTQDSIIQCAVAIGSHIGGLRCAIVSGDIGIDRIEHVAPVRDVGHVLERIVAVAACWSEELVGANAVGLFQIQRIAGCQYLY